MWLPDWFGMSIHGMDHRNQQMVVAAICFDKELSEWSGMWINRADRANLNTTLRPNRSSGCRGVGGMVDGANRF